MHITEEQRQSFAEACKDLIQWRKEYLCPHDIILIDATHAEILSGEASIPIKPVD